ncbi:hypothetical protein RGL42_005002 [Vibrio parahaemolyticus]|nr:hypothetical protein [Vibrio parahaemolyticus]EGQ8886863.1 hypothetical protein [Vibrio parahaemolyticus]EGQ8917815.1 hypothetical protein [Vibrio parahaemolyticus]EGQ8937510.1 hypothetical protein [Vibrio parahaemolyticus]EGR3239902.1 hypothetical protein [Vibrio parahaemolyticus]
MFISLLVELEQLLLFTAAFLAIPEGVIVSITAGMDTVRVHLVDRVQDNAVYPGKLRIASEICLNKFVQWVDRQHR